MLNYIVVIHVDQEVELRHLSIRYKKFYLEYLEMRN